MRIRRSTALLILVWLATLALYLQVRPAPQVGPVVVPRVLVP